MKGNFDQNYEGGQHVHGTMFNTLLIFFHKLFFKNPKNRGVLKNSFFFHLLSDGPFSNLKKDGGKFDSD